MRRRRFPVRHLMLPAVVLALASVATLAASGPPDAEATVSWVRAPSTRLHAQASGTAPVKARLAVGTEVSVVEQKGKWSRVRTEQGQGWVFAARIGEKNPALDDDSFLGDLAGDDVEARETDSVQAIRGLSKTAEGHAARADVAPEHVAAVKRMETWKISDEEMRRFLEQGRLAEYQR